jgi:hypothetical protein
MAEVNWHCIGKRAADFMAGIGSANQHDWRDFVNAAGSMAAAAWAVDPSCAPSRQDTRMRTQFRLSKYHRQ